MAYGDSEEPGLLVMISFNFYIIITPHILARDVAVQQEAKLGMLELTAMGTAP